MQNQPIIFITGCASGIGKYLAEQLYTQNYRLVITDINFEALENLAQQHQWKPEKIILARLDVSKASEWQSIIAQVLAKWGSIDVLMNVAGVIKPGFIHQNDLKDVDFHIDINLKGTIYGCKLVAEQMVKQGHGHLINVASLAGVTPVNGLNLYAASKFGVRGFSLSIAQELKKYGIAVSLVCPDAVQTPMLDLQLDYPEAALTFSSGKPLTVEEIGQVILKKALKQRKLEVLHPPLRGFISKLVSFRPALADLIMKSFIKKGLKEQAKRKKIE